MAGVCAVSPRPSEGQPPLPSGRGPAAGTWLGPVRELTLGNSSQATAGDVESVAARQWPTRRASTPWPGESWTSIRFSRLPDDASRIHGRVDGIVSRYSANLSIYDASRIRGPDAGHAVVCCGLVQRASGLEPRQVSLAGGPPLPLASQAHDSANCSSPVPHSNWLIPSPTIERD
jgi:hypothetical protein